MVDWTIDHVDILPSIVYLLNALHHSQSCLNGFPLAKGYKTVTLSDVLTAKQGKAVAKTVTKAVTATIETIDSDEEVVAAAAILPESPGTYVSDTSDGWNELSECDMSPSIQAKHLLWDCQIHGLINDFPVKTHKHIDNGVHLVLICLELVTELGLKKYCLHDPKIIDVTFNNDKKQKKKLYNCVKLALTSLDSQWTSCTMKALIMPGSCMPIILRLPWLIQNSIVTNHAACTCIDKLSSYDLLNPPVILLPLPPKLHL